MINRPRLAGIFYKKALAEKRGLRLSNCVEIYSRSSLVLLKDAQIKPHIERFISSAKSVFKDIKGARHIGSMYTIKAILPGVEATDDRPTLVERVSERLITVFGGKIVTCVKTARDINRLIS